MKVSMLRIHPRTMTGLYYSLGGFTIFVLGVALCVLAIMTFLPEAKEVPWR
jgi:hypothetical protein